jgi:hypothetical protein
MQFPQNIQSLPHETPGASLHSLLRGDDALTNAQFLCYLG